MKNTFALLLSTFICCCCAAQWQLVLTIKQGEGLAGLSASTDNNIWAVTNNFIIYNTHDAGAHWNRVKPKGFANNISIIQLYTLNATTAFLSVNVNSGVGPGIIYKTTDTGHHWVQVFLHKGTCEIVMGMFNNVKGLMSCGFDSFNGSIPSGQRLYKTIDGGNTWQKDTNNPASFVVMTLETKNKTMAGMADYKYFYYSPNRGKSWYKSKRFPSVSSPKRYLQFEDSNYVVLNADNLTDLLVKRPASANWLDLHTPDSIGNGAITGIVLDGSECWLSQAFDTNKLYYSADSLKTFTSTIPDANSGFGILTKARNGRTLVAGTAAFMQGKIWLNKRSQQPQKNLITFAKKDY